MIAKHRNTIGLLYHTSQLQSEVKATFQISKNYESILLPYEQENDIGNELVHEHENESLLRYYQKRN
jgi:hypothetical protein